MKITATRLVGIVVLLMLLGLTLCAQQNQIAGKAQAAYDKKAFADGAPLFLLAAQVEPKMASGHLYNAACCYALSGQKDLAFSSLEVAIAKGWRNKQHTEEDEDLASLRVDPRWKDVLSKVMTGGMEANRDAVINDLNNLAALAYQYRIRPSNMGGGNGEYTGLKMPEKMQSNENGAFTYTVAGPNEVKIKAVSAKVKGAAIETTLDGDGRLKLWTYWGEFQ